MLVFMVAALSEAATVAVVVCMSLLVQFAVFTSSNVAESQVKSPFAQLRPPPFSTSLVSKQ